MFKKLTLPNGLRILTAPMQGTNTVTVFVMCGTGSDNEPAPIGGISHFLEHMFFKGTHKRPNHLAISQELDAMGSLSNAFTTHETTGYFVKAGAPYLDRCLDLLADIYKHSLLPEAEIEKEKQVVIEEMHMRRDEPTSYIWQLWESLLWGDQPAGREVIGTEGVIRGLGRKDFLEYFIHQYVAENTAVVIAGNFDERKGVGRVGELFGDVRTGKPRQKPSVAEMQTEPQFRGEKRAIDQTHLLVGFRGYDAFHPKRYAADILGTILGGGWSSRMFVRIREELGLAYTVFTTSENYSNRGYFLTYAGVTHDRIPATVQAILGEYRRIREKPVSTEELGRTKDYIKGRMLMELETSNAVASHVGGEEMLTAKPLTTDEVFARIDQVTAADCTAVAEELFRPERLNAAILGPEPEAGDPHAVLEGFS